MKRRLTYSSIALRELNEIAEYITQASDGDPDRAAPLLARLKSRCERLAELPGIMGTQRDELGDEFRSTPVNPYIIFFRYRGDAIEIVSIVHGHRDLQTYFGSDDLE